MSTDLIPGGYYTTAAIALVVIAFCAAIAKAVDPLPPREPPGPDPEVAPDVADDDPPAEPPRRRRRVSRRRPPEA